MNSFFSLVTRAALAGDHVFARQPLGRRGFMILISLIAVAVAGLLMVSTAPDLSSAAVSLKAKELSVALGGIRRAIRSQPLYLTTTDFTVRMPSGEDRPYVTGDFYSPDTLSHKIRQLLASEQQAHSGGVLGAGASFLTTVPQDPYVPIREWYDPATNPLGLFWGASYNAVKNPCYLAGISLESYVAEAFWVYHSRRNVNGDMEIWRSDRFGQNLSLVISYRGADIADPAISPDGTRIAYLRLRPSESNVFVASDDGSNETQITDTGTTWSYSRPVWSPSGSHILFQRGRPAISDSSGLILTYATGTAPTDISTGSWGPMTIHRGYDWSGDGRYFAYTYTRSGMTSPRLAVYSIPDKQHLIIPDGLAGPRVSPTCPVSISPSSNDVLYATEDSSQLWVLPNLRSYPALSIPYQVADGSIGPFRWARWLPQTVRPAVNVTGRWLLFITEAAQAGWPTPPCLARKRADPPADSALQQEWLKEAFLVSRHNPIATGGVSLSTFGSHVTYRGTTGTPEIYLDAIDGSRGTVLIKLDQDLPIQPSPFGATREFWVVPPANGQLVSSGGRASFDANAWRILTNREADFEGDNRFGSTYLRVSPPGRQRHFLIDNGVNSFIFEDDPPSRGKTLRLQKQFLSKVNPTWSPRGLTFVAKKSISSAGEPPLECFKEALDVSATTVLITTGYDPALSPDDKWLAVSRPMGEVTTDAPPRTDYPLLNMDLWIANAMGAPEPIPVQLTPGTPLAQERSPCWSPDGRYIYYQRETQEANPFLGNHNSTIWRITVGGGANTEVVGNAQVSPFWNVGSNFASRVECYSPSISPDGLRLAFIGRERILDTMHGFTSGDIISEAVYVKDLLQNREPVALIRSAHTNHPNKPPGPTDQNGFGFESLSWAPSGEELFAVRMKPINVKFPQWTVDSHRRNLPAPDYEPTETDIVRIVPKEPSVSEKGTAGKTIGAGLVDPANDNFSLVVRDVDLQGFGSGSRILYAKYSGGAYAFQRITSDRPVLQNMGISSDVWYALSAYVRTSAAASHTKQGQVMLQVFNNRGLLVPQVKDHLDFQVGLADVGGPQWNRYSAAVKFDSGIFGSQDAPPYSVNLCLYSISTEVGSSVEFTGLKLEKAFDQEARYPTAFSADWTVFSASKDPDPTRPGYFLFER